jgi:4-aminobutyrate aminotransferase/(S)-3-amino-2-methylpropionate transaminase
LIFCFTFLNFYSSFLIKSVLPELITEIPGPESKRLAAELRRYESHNLTYVSDGFPVFWERAEGANIWDVDGNRFLDLNGGFGVATAGFGAPHLVAAFHAQADTLYHGMGDVHPSRLKVELCRELSRITFERWTGQAGKTILGCAGFEAVEAALKTARMATGKPGVIAFHGSYHGLGYGAMSATGMEKFRQPFLDQLKDYVRFLEFPDAGSNAINQREDGDHRKEAFVQKLQQAWDPEVGAILVEPIQGRGGERFPHGWFLPLLREFADRNGILLIFDEIYTGFFRTGKWFACDYWKTVPDLICLGKGLSGSYPISACVGNVAVMDAWPESEGEAIHTSTFLGNPMGCALALASIRGWEAETGGREQLHQRFELMWSKVVEEQQSLNAVKSVRGCGLLWAIEFNEPGKAVELMKSALREGLIVLPAGETGSVLSIKPSVVHTDEEAEFTAGVLKKLILERTKN